MEKYSSEQIDRLLEQKKENNQLKSQESCTHKDIVKCFLNGKAHKYVCMNCGYSNKSRAAFFSYPESDRQMG
ncbi:hypothetical protein ACFOLA_10375 [Salinicoccus hispanicus]|uniref:Uncharacterized protein n=1 Tax=Salinicoccus hispanicus TaxID=157225 RepID=A0A6N8TWA3_9STAP|nr:hypothetical protein [Salinicoccus hispanicus]MXQ49692.1 hypothetical protein [Salinicoccus hispanicus]